ncbi:type II secretion system F family protein [Photobacterium sp. GJ3]|uniref:type II secretion system F family protein n=1 Tax=Photobacterium sp. GJ3 TaxID=2829502 RepID=UPI001B8BA8B8|nr:type II secretion system F family protein [Photobacterium sp. GJ3]QUJ67080.1 type II secretion system F family protein [Photobacterium sp. GJ3]
MTTGQLHYYRWRGRQHNGRTIRGLAVAYHPRDIALQLKAQHTVLLDVQKRKPGWLTRRRHQLRSQDLTQILRQLGILLNASLPMSNALTLLAQEQTRMEAGSLLHRVQSQVATGIPLSAALRQSLPTQDSTVDSLLTAGEHAGLLPEMLQQIAAYRERFHALQRQLQQAMIYPVVVCMIALAVTLLMLLWVMPQFVSLYASMDQQLPGLTRTVLALSEIIARRGLPFSLFAILLGWLCHRQYRRSLSWQQKLHCLGLRMPVIGPLWHSAVQARFTRTLGLTFQAGVPLLTGIRLAAATCGNRELTQAYLTAAHQVSAGQFLSQSLRQHPLIPDRLVQMIRVGEETGQLGELLLKIAEQEDSALTHRLKTLTTLTEPILILTIGLLVGTLLLAMYLPVFDLMKVVG